MIHLVQFSTGAASAEVAFRAVEQYGAGSVHLLTADTLVEDNDNWRFAREVVVRLGCSWTTLADGRTPMQAGRDARVVPNNRLAVCSRTLKRELLRKYINRNYDPATTVVHLGFDWTEEHRKDAAAAHWEPYSIKCLLMEPPLLMKEEMLDLFRSRGIEPPRLYAQGFAHANCGGACVRGGHAQWKLLLKVNRSRYLQWEAEEDKTRAELGRDVAILRDRRGGTLVPLPLGEFRRRVETEQLPVDESDWGACGCFVADDYNDPKIPVRIASSTPPTPGV